MAEVKWIKIVADIFDDEKMLLIESLPSADSLIVIWFKLLCLAGKNNNNGVFILNDKIPYTDEMLATIFRRDVNTVRLALKTFEDFGMILIVDGVITIPNWGKHQTLDRLEARKEYMKGYMQKYRDKQKAKIECVVNKKSLQDVNSNANCRANVNEADKDNKELDNKEYKKENKKEKGYYEDCDLNKAFSDYVKMRKEIKKPMGSRAIELAKTKLNNLSGGDKETMIAILEQSIFYSWQGLFELKERSGNDGTRKRMETEHEESVDPGAAFDIRTLYRD